MDLYPDAFSQELDAPQPLQGTPLAGVRDHVEGHGIGVREKRQPEAPRWIDGIVIWSGEGRSLLLRHGTVGAGTEEFFAMLPPFQNGSDMVDRRGGRRFPASSIFPELPVSPAGPRFPALPPPQQ